MAIAYTREYDRILDDLSRAIATVPQFHDAFEMSAADWAELSPGERDVCVRTLADDLFYVLGSDPKTEVGRGSAEYDAVRAVIIVSAAPPLVHIIALRE